MRIRNKIILGALGVALYANNSYAQTTPDLNVLNQSGFIIGPGSTTYKTHKSWLELSMYMKDVNAFNDALERVESVICGTDTNRSVLITGESGSAYKHLFSKLATNTEGLCKNMWHVEINVSKVEAGHSYVGQVDEYWATNILKPSQERNVVLYLSSLDSLIGIGSHSNDETGIEREYVSNFTGGLIRTVAFADKYEYNNLINGRNSYVANAFAETIVLPPLEVSQVDEIVQAYMKHIAPNHTLTPAVAQQLYRFADYYQPNRSEPDRTMNLLSRMVRNASKPGDGGGTTTQITLEAPVGTPNPYVGGGAWEHVFYFPEFQQVALTFDRFNTEQGYDRIEVSDVATGNVMQILEGPLGAHTTQFYPSSHIKLRFTSDTSTNLEGFNIVGVVGIKESTGQGTTFTLTDLRQAIMEVAQVPAWMLNRDFTVIKELRGKLDGDVVGVQDGKNDLVRLAKNGYIVGRTDEKPIATALLTGPTGTGKSYIAKRFAEYMGFKLITMDMTAYKDSATIRNFVYILSRHLTANPFAVFLFEEIDKASVEVLDQLYFMMDEGIFYDPAQRPLFARGAFVLMTSNAGSDLIIREKDNPNLPQLVDAELQKSFRASFLNRFDAISIFTPFTDAEYRELAQTMAEKKALKIKEFFNWTFTTDAGVLDYMAVQGRSDIYGARPMERVVETVLGTGLANYQLERELINEGATVTVSKAQGIHDFILQVNDDAPFPYTIIPDFNNGDTSFPSSFSSARNWRRLDPGLDKFFRLHRDYND